MGIALLIFFLGCLCGIAPFVFGMVGGLVVLFFFGLLAGLAVRFFRGGCGAIGGPCCPSFSGWFVGRFVLPPFCGVVAGVP